MEKELQCKLDLLRMFQSKYPKSHVGGSIGLMLRGIDLKRNLSYSDLDVTTDTFIPKGGINLVLEKSNNDFDYCYEVKYNDNIKVKIDIKVDPNPAFDVINFEGYSYNVSKLADILTWKQKYANKGSSKHENDLIAIETGKRPKK